MRAVWVVLLVGCSSNPDAVVDAAVDAPTCVFDYTFTPVEISGTAPNGSLAGLHYAIAGYLTGFCPPSYIVTMSQRPEPTVCNNDPYLTLTIAPPFEGTNPHASTATYSTEFTDRVSFQATQLDQPDANPAHIVGHFVSDDPAWTFDIPVDLVSQWSEGCL